MIGQTLALACRNLSRHVRRTAINVAAIAFGVVAMVLAGGFGEWMVWMERESTIHSRLGHLQIVRRGYHDRGAGDPYAYLIGSDTVDIKTIASLAHVRAIAPRLVFSGLISKGETTISFQGEGVVPEAEVDLSRDIVIRVGRQLASSAPTGIVLGNGLAANLGAEPGAKVVLVTTTGSGSISAVEADVVGVFQTAIKAFDDVALRVPLPLARRLMKTDGAHQLLILLDDTGRTDEMRIRLGEVASARDRGLEIVPWSNLADFYWAVVDFFSSQTRFVRMIIALIIVLSMSNTLMASVRERTSEIGTLMATGTRRSRVVQLFVAEGLVMGVSGGVIGMVAGLALANVISAVGIPMPPAPGMDQGFDAEIRVTSALVAGAFLVAVVASAMASVYPAWKASRLNIVDALRRAT